MNVIANYEWKKIIFWITSSVRSRDWKFKRKRNCNDNCVTEVILWWVDDVHIVFVQDHVQKMLEIQKSVEGNYEVIKPGRVWGSQFIHFIKKKITQCSLKKHVFCWNFYDFPPHTHTDQRLICFCLSFYLSATLNFIIHFGFTVLKITTMLLI